MQRYDNRKNKPEDGDAIITEKWLEHHMAPVYRVEIKGNPNSQNPKGDVPYFPEEKMETLSEDIKNVLPWYFGNYYDAEAAAYDVLSKGEKVEVRSGSYPNPSMVR